MADTGIRRRGRRLEIRSVSRCVAIAAHGKRCQQSPFRGSPYCWHHTQSRKIWAPSRPLGAAPRPAGPVDGVRLDERRANVDRRTGEDRRAGRAAQEAAARRLAGALGPARVEEMLGFLESDADGAYLLVRDEGGLITEHSVSEPPARRRASASG
jgi:hypothetical protein